jgi:hypothetical protein
MHISAERLDAMRPKGLLTSLTILEIIISDLYALGIPDATFQSRKAAGNSPKPDGGPGREGRA